MMIRVWPAHLRVGLIPFSSFLAGDGSQFLRFPLQKIVTGQPRFPLGISNLRVPQLRRWTLPVLQQVLPGGLAALRTFCPHSQTLWAQLPPTLPKESEVNSVYSP